MRRPGRRRPGRALARPHRGGRGLAPEPQEGEEHRGAPAHDHPEREDEEDAAGLRGGEELLDVGAEEEPHREEPGRVSSVQYVRFPVADAQALLRGPAFLLIDHPAYAHRVELSEATRRSLAQDLS